MGARGVRLVQAIESSAYSEKLMPEQFDRAWALGASAKSSHNAEVDEVTYKQLLETAPVQHTAKELQDMMDYAARNGVQIRNPEVFDGDMEMIREAIDIIAEVRDEYDVHGRLSINFVDSISNYGLGQTSASGDTIHLLLGAYRDRALTDKAIAESNYLSGLNSRAIAYHEMGHVLSSRKGQKGLVIATKAYYNVTGKNVTYKQMLDILKTDVSQYSRYLSPLYDEDRTIVPRHYHEIIPEIIAKDHTNPSQFSREFIRLLKEAYNL